MKTFHRTSASRDGRIAPTFWMKLPAFQCFNSTGLNRSCDDDHTTGTKVESPNLHIQGNGLIHTGFQQPDTALVKDTKAVISEFIELIWRLEKDRQEAEEALKLEKARKQTLIAKVDKLSLWKLHHLPEAIQKEYEAVEQDISELQWHIACKEQDLHNALSKAFKTEEANAKIQEEIDFLKKHSPLLDDKLTLESDVMEKIKQAQEEATALLAEAELTRKASELKFEEATMAANKERMEMATELGKIKTKLQSCRDILQSAETVWAEDNTVLVNTEKQIADGKNLYTELKKEKEQVKQNQDMWNHQVNDKKYELDDQEMKMKNVTNEYSALQKESELMKSDFESQLSYLENLFHNKLHALRDLEYENKTITLENEDLLGKIAKCTKAKIMHEADIQRMQKNIIENEAQTLNIAKELPEIYHKHSATKTKLEELKEQSSKEESRMKNLTDTLRKKIAEEVRISQLTELRIRAIANEMQQKENEHKKTKDELVKVVEEIEKPVEELEKKVIKLRLTHKQKLEALQSVQQIKQNCDEKFRLKSLQLGHRKNTLKQQLSDTQVAFSKVSEELRYIFESTDHFLNETRDVVQYGVIVGKAINTTENAVTVLQEDYNILQLKLNDLRDIDKHLHDEIDKYTDRRQNENENYQMQIQHKQEMEKKSRESLMASLNENKLLSEEYQMLQTCFLDEQDKLMSIYEERLRMEATLRDYFQISMLQNRMHRALLEFFKQRGLYNQAGLARFQAASQENAQKILAVQEEMSKTILHISAFLSSLTDGSPRDDSRENNQSISDAETKDKKSHTVQITV
uniref:Coiled-coil domain-containing protein 178 n=1 Tax=Leptobrachium leishanense TaxID=445787 RepID=A0A8C5WGZ9_9ANUR